MAEVVRKEMAVHQLQQVRFSKDVPNHLVRDCDQPLVPQGQQPFRIGVIRVGHPSHLQSMFRSHRRAARIARNSHRGFKVSGQLNHLHETQPNPFLV